MYVVNDSGERISCPHPIESMVVDEVLGVNAGRSVVRARTGFNSHCLCLDCLHQFDADLGHCPHLLIGAGRILRFFLQGFVGVREDRDERVCPSCGSGNVRTEHELVGDVCPSCKQGKFVEEFTGLRS